MTLLLTLLVAFYASGLLVLIAGLLTAPVGFQDNEGFHSAVSCEI